MEDEIHSRLEKQGLQKVLLPLGATLTDRHVPIFATPDLKSKSRIVVIFGEPSQDLGVIAGRIANGPGGIDQGSMVSLHQFEPCAGSNDDTRSGVVSAALPPDLVETRTYRHATDLDAELRAGSSDATLEHP